MAHIRDCSFYCEAAYWLARLRAMAAQIAEDDAIEDAIIEAQKRSCLASGHGYTDPRDGITYFPARKERQR